MSSDLLTQRPTADPAELRPDVTEVLRAALATRLHFLDGAMGTVIQQGAANHCAVGHESP